MPLVPPNAWIEPGTASLCLYCSTLLIRGRAGARLLSRNFRYERETITDIALDELSEFLCNHPDLLLTILFVSASFLTGPDGTPRCRLIARAPALIRSTRTLTRTATKTLGFGLSRVSNFTYASNSQRATNNPDAPDSDIQRVSNFIHTSIVSDASILPGASDVTRTSKFPNLSSVPRVSRAFKHHLPDSCACDATQLRPRTEYSNSPYTGSCHKLLYFLRRPDSTPVRLNIQQTQKKSKEPRTIRLCALPANPLRLPIFLRRTGRGKGPALHILCQLATTIVRRWTKKDRTSQKAHAAD